MSLSRQNRARWAYIKSFAKRRWRFEDYPIDFVDQGEPDTTKAKRFWHPRWRADLINWYSVSGLGDTKEAALSDAKRKFAEWKTSGQEMWRPGKGPGIVFPENQEIDRHVELRDDFIHRILQLEWAWLTDESSLWDFHHEENNQQFHAQIYLLYGVETSDIENAKHTRDTSENFSFPTRQYIRLSNREYK